MSFPRCFWATAFFSIMINSEIYDFVERRLVTQDCVPRATYVQVSVEDRIPGTGHDEYRGYAMLSQWKISTRRMMQNKRWLRNDGYALQFC